MILGTLAWYMLMVIDCFQSDDRGTRSILALTVFQSRLNKYNDTNIAVQESRSIMIIQVKK